MLDEFQISLDVMGLAQGVILGILLIVLNKSKNRSTFFLGLFVLFFSLKLVYFIGRNLNLNGDYPELLLLPFNFSWLLFPLFLIYTFKVSVFSSRKPPYWTLIPGIIFALVQIYVFFLPYEIKLSIDQNPFHDFFHTYIGILYSWSIALWNLKLLYQHRIEVRNSFSQVQARELQWARIFLIYSIITSFIVHSLYFIAPLNINFKILYSIFDLITIYWVAIHGILQHSINSILDNENSNLGFNGRLLNEIEAKLVLDSDMIELSKQLDDYIITTEAFTNTELTIADVAENMKIHAKSISTAINTVHKQNFNSYINSYRIKKAERLIKNKDYNHLSIEGIAGEVGFNSKSAFYSAFKKQTGTTPTRYKKMVT